jgi:hypothetical protein
MDRRFHLSCSLFSYWIEKNELLEGAKPIRLIEVINKILYHSNYERICHYICSEMEKKKIKAIKLKIKKSQQ